MPKSLEQGNKAMSKKKGKILLVKSKLAKPTNLTKKAYRELPTNSHPISNCYSIWVDETEFSSCLEIHSILEIINYEDVEADLVAEIDNTDNFVN